MTTRVVTFSEKKENIMQFICVNCGRKYEASKFWSKFCSSPCRQAAYNSRLRDEKNQKPKPAAKPEKDV